MKRIMYYFKNLWRNVKAYCHAIYMLRYRSRFDDLRCYRCVYRKSGDPKKLKYCKDQWRGTATTCHHFRYDPKSLYEKVTMHILSKRKTEK